MGTGRIARQGNAAAKASEFVIYPDAPHAFHADYRASYRAAPAADGWNRALAWFRDVANGTLEPPSLVDSTPDTEPGTASVVTNARRNWLR